MAQVGSKLMERSVPRGFPKPWRSHLPQELLPQIAGGHACQVLSATHFTPDVTIKVGSLKHHSHHHHCLRQRRTQSVIDSTLSVRHRTLAEGSTHQPLDFEREESTEGKDHPDDRTDN